MAKPGRKKAPVAAAGIVRAWPFLKPDPEYAAAFREMAAPPVFEDAPFPIRIQTEADLAAAEPWGLLAWQDPLAEPGPAWLFWIDAPMLEGIATRRAAPFLPLAAAAGATVTGLRLADGDLIMKIEQGVRAVQVRIETARPFTAEDGIRLFLDVDLELSVRIRRLRDIWHVTGGPPPRQGRVWGAGTMNF